jgi:DNA polymerase III gamma/tau subunit
MPRQIFVQKYAPAHLNEIYGQEFPVHYFECAAGNPDAAYRNYVILGPMGVGKTTLVRAFANDLLGVNDASQTPQFLELDSYRISDRQTLLALKDYMFQEVNGYKVVLLDEWHLVDPTIQAGLLKDIESSTLPIFFFFVSTERSGILDTIMSRSIDFTLTRYTVEQLKAYLRTICGKEGIEISPATQNLLAFQSFGHIRNLLNQLELMVAVGEAPYAQQAQQLTGLVVDLFAAPSQAIVDGLSKFPYTLVQEVMGSYLHEQVIRTRSIFDPQSIIQVFQFYLRFKRYIQNENDFFSFLSLFQDFLKGMRRVNA